MQYGFWPFASSAEQRSGIVQLMYEDGLAKNKDLVLTGPLAKSNELILLEI
jgi:hypothetical protein